MKRKHLSLAIGLAFLASPLGVHAQEAPAPAAEEARDPATLESVQVTARRRTETLQDIPVAVTAFTPDALDRLNVQDLGDIGAQVPNLTIYAARGSNSTLTAYIRGVGQADPLWGVDPGVGLYLDDVYVARPQGALLDVFDIGRIEVLRGPQGTLYGKNTIGGAIKYVSADLPTELEGFGSLTIGNYGQADFRGAIGGGLNDIVRARVAVASLNRDGYGENVRTGEDVSDKAVFATRLSVGIFPSDTFDLKLSADFMDDGSGVRGARMLAPNPFAAASGTLDSDFDVRNGMPNVNDTQMSGTSATATWLLGDRWSLKSITAYRESDTETNIDFDTLVNPLADVKAFYSDEQTSQEFQLAYDGADSRGVIGLYWFDGEAGGQVLNNFFGAVFGDTQGTVYTESLALYGDWTFDLNERLSLTTGLRWTDEEKRADVLNRGYTDATYTVPTTIAADFDRTISFSNVSPRISLDYRLTDDILLYGLASRGFKSGGFNIRANATAVPRSAEPFEDEQVDSVEVGLKMGFLDDRLFLNTAYFYNDYQDIQLSVFTAYDSNNDGTNDAFFGDFTNAGKGTVQGVEVEFQYKPSAAWLISGNWAWLDAEYDEFLTSGVNVASQQRFTNAPEASGALNVEYMQPLDGGGSLNYRVGATYQGEVWPTTDLSPAIRQGAYSLLNAGVIWNTDGAWSFAVQGNNLTDESYRTTGYNIPVLGVLTGFYGAPRTYSISARYRF